jgi:hypothetical protein
MLTHVGDVVVTINEALLTAKNIVSGVCYDQYVSALGDNCMRIRFAATNLNLNLNLDHIIAKSSDQDQLDDLFTGLVDMLVNLNSTSMTTSKTRTSEYYPHHFVLQMLYAPDVPQVSKKMLMVRECTINNRPCSTESTEYIVLQDEQSYTLLVV